MKKLLWLPAAAVSVMLFSCSQSQGSVLISSDADTLKKALTEKEGSITWTAQLEPDTLTKSTKKFDSISSGIELTSDLFKAISPAGTPIFPSLEELGSLDLSGTSRKLIAFIEDCASAVEKSPYDLPQSYISTGNIFSYVFFCTDFENEWERAFGEKPSFSSKESPDSPWFRGFIISAPVESSDLIQVPVRFFLDGGSADLLFILPQKGDYKIKQIEILGIRKTEVKDD